MDKYTLMPIKHIRYVLSKQLQLSVGARCVHQGSQISNEAGVSNTVASRKPGRSTVKKDIKIPERIERSSMDILKALASTVGTDFTAAHYKYHDDPFLIPNSNMHKRMYSLSKESGRKAAKWVREQHPELYYHKNADPPVMSFLPDPTLENAINGVTEETVQSFISLGLLTEAIKAFEVLKSNGEPSREIKQSLLEMVAFYNETEPVNCDSVDERWFIQQTVDQSKNTWKNQGLAEQLFEELSPQDGKAYSALIRGAAKYRNDLAYKSYQEALSKNLTLDAPTFNAVLRVIYYVVEHEDMRVKLLEETLVKMKEQGLQPNLGTLNSALRAVSSIGNFRTSKTLHLQILAEFRRAGIKPSLATYTETLLLFCREKGPRSDVLVDIMKEIQGQEFDIQDPNDTRFFVTAMETCRNHLQSLELADKVHQLLMTGRNYDLIGDSMRESVYYRYYTILRVTTQPLDEFFKFYDKMVQNVYSPEPVVIEEILRVVQINGAVQYIPQLFSDMILFEFTYRENLVTLVLQIINEEYPSDKTEQSINLGQTLADVGWKIYKIIEQERSHSGNAMFWTGNMIGDLLCVLVKADRMEQAEEVMKKLVTSSQKVVGAVPLTSLNVFLQAVIRSNNSPMCLACLQYTSETGYSEVAQMAEEIMSEVTLDAVQTARLNNIVGFDVAAKVVAST